MNLILRIYHIPWQFWVLQAPQYHLLMLLIALACLAMLISIRRRLRNVHTDECPCCHEQTLLTVQSCKSCKFIRTNTPSVYGR